MKQEFKNKFPQWVFEENDYTVCLSDDLDSLVGAMILKQVKGWETTHFYDFEALYSVDKTDKRRAVGIDIALESGMTFDNHVVRLTKNDRVNPLSANPNVIENISRENYTEKYAMSTTLLLWSLYDLPLPATDKGKLLLLSIDSSYLGHYKGFQKVQNEWLRKLGFEELIEIQNKYTIKDFVNVKKEFDSSLKIELTNEGTLTTRMNLEGISQLLGLVIELPKYIFEVRKTFERKNYSLSNNKCYSKSSVENILGKDIFSLALTSKNYASLTLM